MILEGVGSGSEESGRGSSEGDVLSGAGTGSTTRGSVEDSLVGKLEGPEEPCGTGTGKRGGLRAAREVEEVDQVANVEEVRRERD